MWYDKGGVKVEGVAHLWQWHLTGESWGWGLLGLHSKTLCPERKSELWVKYTLLISSGLSSRPCVYYEKSKWWASDGFEDERRWGIKGPRFPVEANAGWTKKSSVLEFSQETWYGNHSRFILLQPLWLQPPELCGHQLPLPVTICCSSHRN